MAYSLKGTYPGAPWVIVVIERKHLCMTMRGACKQGLKASGGPPASLARGTTSIWNSFRLPRSLMISGAVARMSHARAKEGRLRTW